jgi:membrane-bound serine protease (ClpP class)
MLAPRRKRGPDSGDNGRVILVTGILIAIFVVPDPWTLPVIGLAVVVEVSETLFTLWWSRRAPPKVGPETLIGSTGRVVEPLRPIGRVRVRGEVWRARSDEELGADVRVRVTDRSRLTLTVERIDE